MKRFLTAAGSAIVLGATLLVGAPAASAAPADDTPVECRVDNWMSGTLQIVTYSNCATHPVDKRATIGGDVGPCVTVPPMEWFHSLHSRRAPGPYDPWPFSVEDC